MSFQPPSLARLSVSVVILWTMALPLAFANAVALPVVGASSLPSELTATPLEQWQPAAGDSLLIDTKENTGYLVHEDGGYAGFPVVTGQRRVVRYIGRVYNATTPTRTWTVLSQEVKGDRITFGKRGEFLRLFKDGEERTPYGIHSHAYAQKMLADKDRYRSMGCVIVSDQILDVLTAMFALNNDRLTVITTYGLGEGPSTEPMLQAMLLKETQKDL